MIWAVVILSLKDSLRHTVEDPALEKMKPLNFIGCQISLSQATPLRAVGPSFFFISLFLLVLSVGLEHRERKGKWEQEMSFCICCNWA